jgi:amino acid transporter
VTAQSTASCLPCASSRAAVYLKSFADHTVYIASAFLIGLLVSPTDPSLDLRSTAAKSPFVIAIKNAGIPALPGIINAVLLSSAWSAGNADLCEPARRSTIGLAADVAVVSSRALYAIAVRGHAPRYIDKYLLKTRQRDGLPYVCVLICAAFSLLSFLAASQNKSAGQVFGYCELYRMIYGDCWLMPQSRR